MKKDTTPLRRGKPCPAWPAHRVGDTVIFKYEGNLRARVEGYEEVNGEAWLKCRADLDFLILPVNLVGVEPEE